MKHIALNHYSRAGLNKPWDKNCVPQKLYTAPGLGDRVTCLYCVYQYAERHGTDVTVHLNKNHTHSGNPKVNKPKSWKEVLDLFPKKKVNIEFHEEMQALSDWQALKYLQDNKNINASMYYYNVPSAEINITNYFKNKILLKAKKQNIELPKNFVTMQWDGSDTRQISEQKVNRIKLFYKNNGYDIIEIGKSQSLAEIGYYLSNADYHIGMDSGMFHMAQLYMRHDQIHVYTGRQPSAHSTRAKENGSSIDFLK